MRITFLGTGTSTGNPQILCECRTCLSKNPKDIRLRSSIYIETEDSSILIDCGPDFRQQALRYNLRKIDSVILTHEHYDHVGGMDDLRPFCKQAGMPVYAYERVLDKLKNSMPYSFTENPYSGVPVFKLHTVTNNSFFINETLLIPIELMHYKLPVLGIRIGEVAYLTDFNFISKKEIEKLHGLKVLIIDALRSKPHISHNSLNQAINLIETVKPEQSWLIHMSHEMGLHDEVDSTLPDCVRLSWDGLIIDI
jgi:phosphoribosyl 1,2-cyclic phosphate phosphodiesterase